MKIVTNFLTFIMMMSVTFVVQAQERSADGLKVTGHNKTAIIATEGMKRGWYDGVYHFSPAVRAGDFLFLSGVVVGIRGEDAPIGRDAFKQELRRGFTTLQTILIAAGADTNSIVKITSYHVFDSPLLAIKKQDQVLAMAEVKGEFMEEPHAAWTAVGTTALLPDAGLVEIDIVAYVPLDK